MNNGTFRALNLSPGLIQSIEEMGFAQTTPIQAQAIPTIMEGRDVMGQAQTGTGKTAAFGIPILEMINPLMKKPQALILCPTRELAIQVAEELRRLATYQQGILPLPIYGGQSIGGQIRALQQGAQIVIGTPGRVMDHLRRKTLFLEQVKTVVLDEADVMLDMGFVDDIETILQDVPEKRQTLLFSATIPPAILHLRKKYQNHSIFIKVVQEELTVPEVEQYYFPVKEENKLEALTRLLDLYTPIRCLIFCNTRRKVEALNVILTTKGYSSHGLHGLMKQAQRDQVMNTFRHGLVKIMVATDVAARGIDVDHVEIVFNYDVPQDMQHYIHRIGRTARVGRSGKAFTFVAGKEMNKIRDIQRFAKTKIQQQKIPSLSQIQEAKTEHFLKELLHDLQEGSLEEYIGMLQRLSEDGYSSMEIAAVLLKRSLAEKGTVEKEKPFGDPGTEPGMARLFINVGKKKKIHPRHIVGAIAGETGLPGRLIGAVDVYDGFTLVEIPQEQAPKVMKIMEDNYIKGHRVHVAPARVQKAYQ